MNKTEKVISEIIKNEKELREFLKQETMDEMYDFVVKKDSTITVEEFDESVSNILENYVSFTESKEIDEDNLNKVSGGMGKMGQKAASVMLSVLTCLPGAMNMAHATDGADVSDKGSHKTIIGILSNYVSDKYEKTVNIVARYPGIVTVGLVATIVVAATIDEIMEKKDLSRALEMDQSGSLE